MSDKQVKEQESWNDWSRFVLHSIEQLTYKYEKINERHTEDQVKISLMPHLVKDEIYKDLDEIKKDVTIIKVKMALVSIIFSTIASAFVTTLFLIIREFVINLK